MAEISTLPIWKKDASAYERLSELALLAKEKPERFDKFVIVYLETTSTGRYRVRLMNHNTRLVETLGLLELGKLEEFQESCK